jgi:hypothetical protein
MPHYKNLFPTKYIAAHNLDGKDVTLTIRAVVEREEVKTQRGSDLVGILYFEETLKSAKPGVEEKRFILKPTNGDSIAALYGPDYTKWIGKRITLYPTTTSIGGKTVDCIRIRPNIPATPITKPENITNGQD